MLSAFTELKYAQKVKDFLIKKKILDFKYNPVKELNHIYFPIIKRLKVPSAKVVDTKFKFPGKQDVQSIDSLLNKDLTAKQLKLLPRSQEIVGKIMILEVPEELIKKEKIIAEAYLKLNRNVETVVKKSKIHSGVYRTRKVKILAGKRSKETIHFESGIKIKLHLEKTYFSARSGNERLRIAKQVKKGELVLVMFSGAGPYPLVIAKHSLAKNIYAIELNLAAHQYAMENIKLNKITNISLLRGDVRKVIPKLRLKFDRIAMPLPKTGEEFLDVALKRSKKGTIIHLYGFLDEKEINLHAKKIKEICKEQGFSIRIIRKVKCGQFSPRVFRVCFDLKVL